MTCHAPRRKGFTLVELLVVIGIIAVLIGILLPSLSAARRQANSVKCLSNLRSIGQGFALYSNDYNGYWPAAYHIYSATRFPLPTNTDLRWYDRIFPYVGNSKDVQAAADIGKARDKCAIWGCPEWTKTAEFSASSTTDQLRPGYAMNYYTEDYLTSKNTNDWAYISAAQGRYPQASSSFNHSAQRMLITDSIFHIVQAPAASGGFGTNYHWAPSTDMTYSTNSSADALAFFVDARHGSKNLTHEQQYSSRCLNTLFCDGHADTISVKEAYLAVRNPSGDHPEYYAN